MIGRRGFLARLGTLTGMALVAPQVLEVVDTPAPVVTPLLDPMKSFTNGVPDVAVADEEMLRIYTRRIRHSIGQLPLSEDLREKLYPPGPLARKRYAEAQRELQRRMDAQMAAVFNAARD